MPLLGYEKIQEMQIFTQYLRIPSVHPNIDYGKSEGYILENLLLAKFQSRVLNFFAHKPIFLSLNTAR